MTDKLNLQRLDHDPRLPMRGSIDFERVLYVRLYELFRAIAGVTNQNGEAISDAISNVTTQLTEDINQAIAGVTNQIEGVTNQIEGISGEVDSLTAGAMQKSANLGDVDNVATARGNLGLGNAATRDVGTTAGTVAEGNDSRITGAAQKSANLSDLANATTARNNLGLGTAAIADVVGTMAGGAIIESGSNGNGQYVKFADGTMICGFEFQSSGTGWKTTKPTITLAASFVENPLITYSFISDDTAWSGAASIFRSNRGLNNFQIRPPIGITDNGTSVHITGVAFGRWKD